MVVQSYVKCNSVIISSCIKILCWASPEPNACHLGSTVFLGYTETFMIFSFLSIFISGSRYHFFKYSYIYTLLWWWSFVRGLVFWEGRKWGGGHSVDKKQEHMIVRKGEWTPKKVEYVEIHCTIAEVIVHTVSRTTEPQPGKLTGSIL